MKKFSIILAAAALAMGFASCSDDRDPVYQEPTKFVLNASPVADQYVELAEGQTLLFTCSQPNYGYSAVAEYSLQVALDEQFTVFQTLDNANKTQARITVKQNALSTALCELKGYDESNFEATPLKVYFRAHCEIPGVESSAINSNVIALNKVVPYYSVATPGYIYLVGNPEGWSGPAESNAAHYADWRLFEPADAIGSKIYTGKFDICAAPVFRFYTALTGWDGGDSYGSQAPDEAIEFPDAFAGDQSFSSPMVAGKGSFSFPNWAGGMMTITVDMSDMNNITLTIAPGDVQVFTPRYIYLVGSPEGWTGPDEANADHYNAWRLVDPNESGIYTGTFDMGSDPVFRFYSALTGWDDDSMGYKQDDEATDCTLTNGVFAGNYVAGKGSWSFPGFSGKMLLTVNTNTKEVSFNEVSE